MRAMIIHRHGGPEVLELADLPRPVPQPGETLVRVRAAAVNPADSKWRSGIFAGAVPVTFPIVLGYDVAGEVVGGEGFAIGTRVFGMLDPMRKGGYAEYVAVPAGQLTPIPDDLNYETAAALPTAGLTGMQVVERVLDVQSGERVAVTGALGAVGRSAIWAAKARGAYIIAAVRAAHREDVIALGADQAVILGGDDQPGAVFDAVIDTVGGPDVARLCRHLKPGGRIVTVATTPIDGGLAATPEFYAVRPDSVDTRRLGGAVAAGALTMAIAQVLPLEQAAHAQCLTDGGGAGGKIILRL